MATERSHHSRDEDQPVAATTRRGYRVGPKDMDDFVSLPPDEQRRLADTPGGLDA